MKRIALFIVTLFFCVSFTLAQQVTINYKNGQNTVINVSDIKDITFTNPTPVPQVDVIYYGIIQHQQTGEIDIANTLTDENIAKLNTIPVDEVNDGTVIKVYGENGLYKNVIFLVPSSLNKKVYQYTSLNNSEHELTEFGDEYFPINGSKIVNYNSINYKIFAIYTNATPKQDMYINFKIK